jgi:hypothetical protein
MAGQPTKYDKKTGRVVCNLLARGQSLRQICALDSMPHRDTIYEWIRVNPEFSDNYRRARELQEDEFFDFMRDIAFDESRDITGELKMPNGVAVNRDKLKIDTLKWTLGRMNPGKYGDKVETNHTGSVGLQLIHSIPQPKRDDDKLLEG